MRALEILLALELQVEVPSNTRNEKQRVDKKYLAAKKVPSLLSTQFRSLTILSLKASMNYPCSHGSGKAKESSRLPAYKRMRMKRMLINETMMKQGVHLKA